MKLSEFKFEIPNSLIASHPAENRDDARMMVIHRSTGKIEHKVFKDIVNYFEEGDVMVFDNRTTMHGKTVHKGQRQILVTMGGSVVEKQKTV